jgi:hypothetical protein
MDPFRAGREGEEELFALSGQTPVEQKPVEEKMVEQKMALSF